MKQEFIDLAKYRLEKAKNTLSYAKSYVDDTTLDSTVNRIYYAMFYVFPYQSNPSNNADEIKADYFYNTL